MSRIGKKPIPLPQGVKFEVKGNTVTVQGPKGQVQTHLPAGVKLQTADGHIQVTRESDDRAAVHGLVRALVNNAVEGVTKGWTKELEIVGIGYRAELKGKNTVVFTLGYSHPIEYPLPTGVSVAIDAKQTRLSVPSPPFKIGHPTRWAQIWAQFRNCQKHRGKKSFARHSCMY